MKSCSPSSGVTYRREWSTAQERAFFFDEGTYLGTDTSAPSASISVVSQSDTGVTLQYGIYAPGSSTATGSQRVRFELDMGTLGAIDPIPNAQRRR